jgi:hypothetical protein
VIQGVAVILFAVLKYFRIIGAQLSLNWMSMSSCSMGAFAFA